MTEPRLFLLSPRKGLLDESSSASVSGGSKPFGVGSPDAVTDDDSVKDGNDGSMEVPALVAPARPVSPRPSTTSKPVAVDVAAVAPPVTPVRSHQKGFLDTLLSPVRAVSEPRVDQQAARAPVSTAARHALVRTTHASRITNMPCARCRGVTRFPEPGTVPTRPPPPSQSPPLPRRQPIVSPRKLQLEVVCHCRVGAGVRDMLMCSLV